ncbi:MAG: M1 family aminopeptidase [Planctomycetota bacterium]|nr:M1 family aminopeptidase [Planctomycetota bacterium]
MTLSRLFGGVFLALCAGCALDIDRRRSTVDHPGGAPFDVEHYAIAIQLDPLERAIEATCTLRVWATHEPLKHVDLQLVGLAVSSVTDRASRDLKFDRQGDRFTVELVEPLVPGEFEEITVHYGGKPRAGLWFSRDVNGVATQVFTHGQCNEARAWFPCRDHPSDRATSAISVTMPLAWTSIAAGERIERTEHGEQATELWRMSFPHPSYLETLVAGELEVEHDEWADVPLQYVSAPENKAFLREAFGETGAMLAYFSELTGVRYPYSKYAQVCVDNFPFGGMENVSATTLTDACLPDEEALSDGDQRELIAHEAAHQWFGDLLTCLTWKDIWLNEGFATYCAALYEEHVAGPEAFQRTMRGIRDVYLARDTGSNRRPIVRTPAGDPLRDFFTGHVYQGGATRLHYLRGILGDDVFFAGVRRYVALNRGRSVTTDALRTAFEEVSGRNLKRWFEQWLESSGHPTVSSSWRYDAKARRLTLALEQTQPELDQRRSAFDIEVDVDIATRTAQRTERVRLEHRRTEFDFDCDSEPTWVRVDPRDFVPMELDERMPTKSWFALAEHGDTAGRLRAIQVLSKARRGELKRGDVELVDDFLLKAAAADESADIREAALVATARFVSPSRRAAARELFLYSARHDVDRGVKIAAFKALRSSGRDSEIFGFAEAALARSRGWILRGEIVGLMAKSRPDEAFEFLLRQLETRSAHGVFEARMLAELFATKDARARDVLLNWLRDSSKPDASRAVAVRELARSHLRENELEAVIELLESPRIRMRREALAALATSQDSRAKAALERHAGSNPSAIERVAVDAALDVIGDDS